MYTEERSLDGDLSVRKRSNGLRNRFVFNHCLIKCSCTCLLVYMVIQYSVLLFGSGFQHGSAFIERHLLGHLEYKKR